ncbi:hypothetical protein BC938DRAFT_472321 [Jimgerdemannia flammicorona]|uniref:Uncharacterized protein n=1 Tax=Jimgerdemannia flammicorona TaxID=994334 RepID=A0A433Q6D6_9FUNG|nr:hypothetical protein BC938DRAFT_472321 [Jimgerdemannia flammicorona]
MDESGSRTKTSLWYNQAKEFKRGIGSIILVCNATVEEYNRYLSLARQTCTLLNPSFRQREDLEQWYEDNKDGIAKSDFSVIEYQPMTLHEAEKRASEDEKPVYNRGRSWQQMKCTAFSTVCDKLFGRTVDEMLEIAKNKPGNFDKIFSKRIGKEYTFFIKSHLQIRADNTGIVYNAIQRMERDE